MYFCLGRSGSIRKMSFSHGAQQVMVAPPRLRQQRRLEQQQQQTVMGSLSLSVCPQIGGNNGEMGTTGIPASVELTKGVDATGSIGMHEPKLTPSISNIGSAVLRSKTADFERMLQLQSVKKSAAESDVSTAGLSESICRSSSASAAVSSLVSNNNKRVGPIYKRNELIASVQTSKK